jgi:hypothetical protein
MTSLMKDIFRSSCKVWLETYHGLFVIILKVFDCYVCSILTFDGLAHPHSSIPYVHMGFSMTMAWHIPTVLSHMSIWVLV